jgi:membrane associated rhomboid family serine protease
MRQIEYSAIRSFGVLRPGRGRRYIIEVEGGWPLGLAARWFSSPDAFALIEGELKRRIELQPHSADQLNAIHRRVVVAEALFDARPIVMPVFLVVLFIVALFQWSSGGFDHPLALWRHGANSWWLAIEGGWHRLLVAGYMHGGWWHFLVNAGGLLVVGGALEALLGRWRFVVVALGSLLSASVATYLIGPVPSVGFSLAVYGLVGAMVTLNLFRGSELCLPFTLKPIMLVMFLLVEISTQLVRPDIDATGHWSGLISGALLCLLVLPGLDLASPRASPPASVRGLALGLVLLFAVGLAKGAHYAATADEHDIFRVGSKALDDPDFDPILTRVLSWGIALSPPSTPEELGRALLGAQRLVDQGSDDLELQDLIATLEYRLGKPDRAAARERRILELDPRPYYCSQLTRFESARQSAREGSPTERSFESPVVSVAHDVWQDGRVAFTLEADRSFPAGIDLIALIESDEEILGLLRLFTGPIVAGEPTTIVLAADAEPLPAGSTITLTRIEARTESDDPHAASASYCPMEAKDAALPSFEPAVIPDP